MNIFLLTSTDYSIIIGLAYSLIHSIPTALDTNIPHIMISYQWDAQGIMSKVKDMLMQAGYKVWMDVEHMSMSAVHLMLALPSQGLPLLQNIFRQSLERDLKTKYCLFNQNTNLSVVYAGYL